MKVVFRFAYVLEMAQGNIVAFLRKYWQLGLL